MSFKISIVTATFNRRDYLPRCIESIASQAYPDKEHIIIDGGSTDGTVAVLEEYGRRYPHLRWISEKDDGLSQAFNKGLARTTGDAIGVLGDDDLYLPGAFETVAEAFNANPQAGVIAANCDFIREDGTVWITQKANFTSRTDLIQFWRYWGNRITIPATSSFFRREVLDTVGGFDEADRYAMDYHHWIKITEKFAIVTVNKTIAQFRYDEGTISCTGTEKQAAEAVAISQKYWGSKLSADYYRIAWSYLPYYWRPRLKVKTWLRGLVGRGR